MVDPFRFQDVFKRIVEVGWGVRWRLFITASSTGAINRANLTETLTTSAGESQVVTNTALVPFNVEVAGLTITSASDELFEEEIIWEPITSTTDANDDYLYKKIISRIGSPVPTGGGIGQAQSADVGVTVQINGNRVQSLLPPPEGMDEIIDFVATGGPASASSSGPNISARGGGSVSARLEKHTFDPINEIWDIEIVASFQTDGETFGSAEATYRYNKTKRELTQVA